MKLHSSRLVTSPPTA